MLRNVRLSYEHIFTATKFQEGQPAKFSATFIIPKDHPDLPAVKRAMLDAGTEKFGTAFNTKNGWPRGFTCSLKDADVEVNNMGEVLAEKQPAYKGCYILEANSTKRPLVIGRKKEAITEEDGIVYSGCYVNASLATDGYVFENIKRGVKCYLNGVQFVKDGERFGADAMNDFDELESAGEDDNWMDVGEDAIPF
jgi:hypothetical protein